MDFQLLKTQVLISQDFTTLVPVAAGPIPRKQIKDALLGISLAKFEAVAAAAPTFWNDPDYSTMDLGSPLVAAVIGSLTASGTFTGSDVATIQALATVQIPRWQALGFSECPQAGDIAYALSLP